LIQRVANLAVVALAGLAGALEACGGGGEDDAEEAAAVTRTFAIAFLEGDGAAACDHMTGEAQRETARNTTSFVEGLRGGGPVDDPGEAANG
jgi:hypothetical protein